MKEIKKYLDKSLNIKSSVPTNREQDKVVYGYKKGDWVLSPSVSFTFINQDGNKNNTFSIVPRIGTFISDKSAILGNFFYSQDINDINTKNTKSAVGLGVNYYFMNIKNRTKLNYSFVIGYGNTFDTSYSSIISSSSINLDYFITKNIIISYPIINNLTYYIKNQEYTGMSFVLDGQIQNIFAQPVINLIFKL